MPDQIQRKLKAIVLEDEECNYSYLQKNSGKRVDIVVASNRFEFFEELGLRFVLLDNSDPVLSSKFERFTKIEQRFFINQEKGFDESEYIETFTYKDQESRRTSVSQAIRNRKVGIEFTDGGKKFKTFDVILADSDLNFSSYIYYINDDPQEGYRGLVVSGSRIITAISDLLEREDVDFRLPICIEASGDEGFFQKTGAVKELEKSPMDVGYITHKGQMHPNKLYPEMIKKPFFYLKSNGNGILEQDIMGNGLKKLFKTILKIKLEKEGYPSSEMSEKGKLNTNAAERGQNGIVS